MSAPHIIRLREPWEAEPVPTGTVRYRRRFGWTAKISSEDRVFVAMDAFPDAVRVCVNGRSLKAVDPQQSPARFEITPLLQARNEAVIETDQGRVRNVRLEVHSG